MTQLRPSPAAHQSKNEMAASCGVAVSRHVVLRGLGDRFQGLLDNLRDSATRIPRHPIKQSTSALRTTCHLAAQCMMTSQSQLCAIPKRQNSIMGSINLQFQTLPLYPPHQTSPNHNNGLTAGTGSHLKLTCVVQPNVEQRRGDCVTAGWQRKDAQPAHMPAA